MLVSLLVVCAAFAILMVNPVSRRLRKSFYVKKLPKIPRSVLMPLFWPSKTTAELFQRMEKVLNFYDSLAAYWVGPKLTVICADPVNMSTILMSKHCFNKPAMVRVEPEAANGILFKREGHKWQKDRKNLKMVFATSILKTFEPTLNRQFCDLTKRLEIFVDQPEFDLHDYILGCNLNTLLKTNFRYDYEALHGSNEKLFHISARLAEIVTLRSGPICYAKYFYRFSSLCVEERELIKYLETFIKEMLSHVVQKRNELSNRMATDCDDTEPKILVDRLLELEEKGQMDRRDVIDQILTFFPAGGDTSPFTVLNTLLLLAMNQTVQDRVYEELRANIADDDYIDFDTLTKLEYFDRVLKESMRLLPIIYIIVRETISDLKLTECTIPKRTAIVLNLMKMHRSEKIWGPTALEFDPDRFLPEAVAQRHPFAFIPFSAGPRNCIGNKYAMLSVKMMLCHLLLKYKFTTNVRMSDISYKFDISLKLNIKYLFELEKRC